MTVFLPRTVEQLDQLFNIGINFVYVPKIKKTSYSTIK